MDACASSSITSDSFLSGIIIVWSLNYVILNILLRSLKKYSISYLIVWNYCIDNCRKKTYKTILEVRKMLDLNKSLAWENFLILE